MSMDHDGMLKNVFVDELELDGKPGDSTNDNDPNFSPFECWLKHYGDKDCKHTHITICGNYTDPKEIVSCPKTGSQLVPQSFEIIVKIKRILGKMILMSGSITTIVYSYDDLRKVIIHALEIFGKSKTSEEK